MSGFSANVITHIRKQAESAYTNELLTRARVDMLERFKARGFLGRLRWLFLGK